MSEGRGEVAGKVSKRCNKCNVRYCLFFISEIHAFGNILSDLSCSVN